MQTTLKLAGIYNLLFGIWAVGWPGMWLGQAGINGPGAQMLWQCVGMIVGVYGIGYLAASLNPLRHWPIVLVGFLGKIFGPIGFAGQLWTGGLPWEAAWIILTNDVIWWIPFALILWHAACHMVGRPVRGEALPLDQALQRYKLQDGRSLAEASNEQELAVVFLRHFGCTFTRELLQRLHELKSRADSNGAQLVLVHMLQDGEEVEYLGDAEEVERVADPQCELYRAFGLGKGGFRELFGPSVIQRGIVAIFRGCGVGHLAGDGLQMPGAFRLKAGEIIATQKSAHAGELPDLKELYPVN